MIKIEWLEIIKSIDFQYIFDYYFFYIIFGLIIGIWLIRKLWRKIRGTKTMDNVNKLGNLADMQKKMKDNMVRARIKEIQAEIQQMQQKDWTEYQAMQERHRLEQEHLMTEWNYLQGELKKIN